MSSMGELTFFLGLQVKQQPDGIFISQDKYVADILKKFDYWSIRTATTPIKSNKPLVKDEYGEDVNVHVYRSMIGSLMYLTASRPDIMFAVFACARFQVTPKASHLNAVKRIFRIIESKSKVRNSRNKPVVELKDMVKALLLDKKNQSPAPTPVKAVEESCVTCGGAHSYQTCPATTCNTLKSEYAAEY
ncbi:hypothetical protein Tco_0068010 [Tanacetum coccineum]